MRTTKNNKFRNELGVKFMDFSIIPQFVSGGVTVGAVYGLIGAGFSLVFKASKVVNFAQGEFVVLGGLIAYSLMALLGAGIIFTATAIGATFALVVGLAALLYLVIRQARSGSNEFTFVMVTLAIAIALRGGAGLIWGTEYKTFNLFPRGSVNLLGAVMTYGALITLFVTFIVSVGLWFMLYRTRIGKALRACADNPDAAQTVGIDPKRMVLYSYMGSGLLGALGGVLLTPSLMMSYDNGVILALKGFTAAVAGGLANPFGAIAGGVFIGIIEGLGVGMFSSDLQNAYAFIALLVVLAVRPQGLFGGRTELVR